MTPQEIAEMALQSVKRVLTDKDAPSTALASAAATAMRIAEFEKADSPSTKEPSQMTYDELEETIAHLRTARAKADEPDGSVLD